MLYHQDTKRTKDNSVEPEFKGGPEFSVSNPLIPLFVLGVLGVLVVNRCFAF